MISHCEQESPYEACGLITGKEGMAARIWPMENIDRSPVSFAMDLNQLRVAFEQMEENREELLAIYHSHPTDRAYPSAEDIAMHNYPEAGYIIVSLAGRAPVAKCYQLIGKSIFKLPIVLVD